jgi:hypothetical protein
MAFNPFHSFRKHQKVIFAVLTIICMFVFVLQFGRGDIFERFGGIFGAGKAQGKYVATLHGTKVYEGDLEKLQAQRQMVNSFILSLIGHSIQDVRQEGMRRGDKLDRRLSMVLNHIDLASDPRTRMQTLGGDYSVIQQMKEELKDKEGKDDERRFVEQVEAALNMERRLPIVAQLQGYFGVARDTGGLLDFLLWKQEAAKMGIVLNDEAVRKLLQRETGGRDVLPEGAFSANERFRSGMAGFYTRFGRYTDADIIAALGDEFRVVMTQEALLGLALSYAGPANSGEMPVTVTPAEFLEYFREQRTTVKAALLPISVDDFENQVQDNPSESDLRQLFDKYKKDEPNPERSQPAFKSPRKMRVEWVTADPKSDFYKTAAKRQLFVSAAEQVLAAGNSFAAGGGVGAGALALARPAVSNPVQKATSDYLTQLQHDQAAYVSPDQYDRSYAAASDLGHILAGLASGNPAAAPTSLRAINAVYQANDARLTGATVLGGGLNPLTQVGLSFPYATTVESYARVEPALVRIAEQNEARALAVRNLRTLGEELNKLAIKPDEAKAYADKAIEKYQLKHETMKTARDRYGLFDDPTLAVFKSAEFSDNPERKYTLTDRAAFAATFLATTGTYKPTYWSKEFGDSDLERYRMAQQGFPPQFLDMILESWLNGSWARSQQPTVFWRVEDDPAVERSFAAAKEDVLKAWRHIQARLLARKTARRLENEAKKETWPTDDATRTRDVEAWLASQKYGKPFVLDNVARQLPVPTPNPGQSREYKPYTPPEDYIKYPPRKFTDILLGLTRPGDATYLEDRPENALYVVVLLQRTPPTDEAFKRAFEDAALSDPLWNQNAGRDQQAFVTKFIEKMREDAAPNQTETGKWKLPEGVRLRASRSGPEDTE